LLVTLIHLATKWIPFLLADPPARTTSGRDPEQRQTGGTLTSLHCLKCHLGVITAAWGNQGILAVTKCCTRVALGQAEAATSTWIHVSWC